MLAERLKKARESAGIMQKEVASALGCTTVTISRYETGARKPDDATLIWYAQNCHVSLDYLFGLTDDPMPNYAPENNLTADDLIKSGEAIEVTEEQLKEQLPTDIRDIVMSLIKIEFEKMKKK